MEISDIESSADTDSDSYNTEDEKKTSIKIAPKNKKTYLHKYKTEWEKDKHFGRWIKPSQKGVNYFYCKVCSMDYIGGIAAVKKHNSRSKHVSKLNATKIQPSLLNMVNTTAIKAKKVKQAEVRIASFISEHNIAINVVDHLVQLIKFIKIDASCVDSISCNRTKCTSIIKNVIGQNSFDILKTKLKTNKFSLLVDESTDHASVKHLALVVRLNSNFNISDEFLALLPVKDATAINLYNVIVNFFSEHDIPIRENLIGFAADGANVMMGKNNSLQALLKKDIPHLFVLKCVCHSLALCASYACLKLPDNVEKLVRDIYTYMKYSFKRQCEYTEFQTFSEIKPHKLLQPSQTRWLSLNAVVKRVLEQYNALQLYFQSQSLNDNVDAAYEIQKNLIPINKAYLEFLEYFLPIFTDLNLNFQSESPKIHLLYNNMESAYRQILACYLNLEYLKKTDVSNIQYRNPQNFVPLEKIYCGAKSVIFLSRDDITEQDKTDFRRNCLNFLVESAHQIYNRFPFKSEYMQSLKLLSFLDPKNIPDINSIVSVAMHFPYYYNDINELDREWRHLQNSAFVRDNPMSNQFWKDVSQLKKGDDRVAYPNLIKFVSELLTLPHSSACVERVFSAINLNKTKLRNRLDTSTLSGILHSKRLVSANNSSCFNFEITDELIKLHNNNMYK